MKTNLKINGWQVLLSTFCALALMGTVAEGSRFARIVTFGDSLSDNYNYGPVSNGPVWPAYLAEYLDLEVSDYAYSGALTSDFLVEVDLFLADAALEGVSNRDLFTVAIGGNDFISFFVGGGPPPIPGAIENTVNGIQSLLEAGVRYLVVWTVPDLSLVPATADLPPEEKAGVAMLTESYNNALVAALKELVSGYNCKLVIVDINMAFTDMIANPGDYGLTNVYIPAEYFPVDPDTSLWWDVIHPTTYGHQLLAEFTLDCMLDELVPGKAIGLGGNVPGWVNY